MKPNLIKIKDPVTDKNSIAQAAESIRNGGLVVVPTETVYGIACRADSECIERLNALKNRPPDKTYTLHIGSLKTVFEYVPKLSFRAQKLIANTWPGPLTIIIELTEEQQKIQKDKLGEQQYNLLYYENSIGFRCPNHPITSAILSQAGCPVVMPSANRSGNDPISTAEQAFDELGNDIDLIVDAEPKPENISSTVIKLSTNSDMQILRQGAISPEILEYIATIHIAFVCTGNTCRSPMAEAIFKKRLAEKIGSTVDELHQKGYKVSSAGTMGLSGFPASPEAIQACAEKNIDLRMHKSSAINIDLIEDCDMIFAMARNHCDAMIQFLPEAENKCLLLLGEKDLPDPVGQSLEIYRNCADVIESAIEIRIGELL